MGMETSINLDFFLPSSDVTCCGISLYPSEFSIEFGTLVILYLTRSNTFIVTLLGIEHCGLPTTFTPLFGAVVGFSIGGL